MRVLRRECDFAVTPEQAYTTLYADETDSVWLDSGEGATAGFSFVGAGTAMAPGPVLETLRTRVPLRARDGSRLEHAAPLGWIGWLGYELRAETMGVDVAHERRYPDSGMLWVDRGLLFDHSTGTVTFIALGAGWTSSLKRWLNSCLRQLRTPETREPLDPIVATPIWRDTDEQYLAKVRACQAAIVEGEAYQLCLTTRVDVDVRPDPLAAYLALRRSSASHHGALLRVGEVALLSSSPETFLTVSAAGVIESKPIKGTRPRGATASQDAILRVQLLSSEKERAENLMIVDLMRNDIARVSEVGSVDVPSLHAIETYPHVHQLVSTVRGQLSADRSPVDAIEACFPAGSMTGAPKRRAIELLDELEGEPRGVYAGAFGYLGADGVIDLAMVIRSIVLDARGATIGTGGGVTALSEPDEELAEMKLKAQALLRVLGA
jgi:para-aminobenzoate synthetase component I